MICSVNFFPVPNVCVLHLIVACVLRGGKEESIKIKKPGVVEMSLYIQIRGQEYFLLAYVLEFLYMPVLLHNMENKQNYHYPNQVMSALYCRFGGLT